MYFHTLIMHFHTCIGSPLHTKQGTESVNSIARDWMLGRKKGDPEANEERFMGQGLSD